MSQIINNLTNYAASINKDIPLTCCGVDRTKIQLFATYPRDMSDYRCKYCKHYNIGSSSNKYNENCSNFLNTNLYNLKSSGYEVFLTVNNTNNNKLPLTNIRNNTVGFFIASSGIKYSINIKNNNINRFTIECYYNNKKVIINNESVIYYGSTCKIEGMCTDSNESFMFVSPLKSDQLGKDKKIQSDKIKIVIQGVKRLTDDRHYGFKYLQDEYCQSKSLSSGYTQSGNSYVGDIATRPTNDIFINTGEPVIFTIGLVNNQTDEVKKNEIIKSKLIYLVDQLKEEQLIIQRIKKLDNKLEKATRKLETVRSELKTSDNCEFLNLHSILCKTSNNNISDNNELGFEELLEQHF